MMPAEAIETNKVSSTTNVKYEIPVDVAVYSSTDGDTSCSLSSGDALVVHVCMWWEEHYNSS